MPTPSARAMQTVSDAVIDDGWSLPDEAKQPVAIVRTPAQRGANKVWKLETLSSISDESFTPHARVLVARETLRLYAVPDPPAAPEVPAPETQRRAESPAPVLASRVPVYWGTTPSSVKPEAAIVARDELDSDFEVSEREFFLQGDELIAEHRKTAKLCEELAEPAGSTVKFWQRLFRRS